jgi:drug/metabolite transporter (DMT)-like permease
MREIVQTTPATGSLPGRAAIDPTGLMLALAGAFLYSWKPIFIKINYAYGVDAPTQLVLRMGISLPFYVAMGFWALRQRRNGGLATDLSARTVVQTCAIGVVGYYVASLLDTESLAYITAQFERLILFTYPTFVALIGYWLFKERLGPAHLAALALTYAGLALIFVHDLASFGDQVITGTVLVLACSLAYALYILWSKARIARMGSGLFTAISMIAATPALIIHFAVTNHPGDLAVPMPVIWSSLGMAIFSTVVPSFLFAEAIARIGPGPASVTGGSGPLFTTLFAVFLLGEAFTPWHAAGMLLVIAGIVVLSREKR